MRDGFPRKIPEKRFDQKISLNKRLVEIDDKGLGVSTVDDPHEPLPAVRVGKVVHLGLGSISVRPQ